MDASMSKNCFIALRYDNLNVALNTSTHNLYVEHLRTSAAFRVCGAAQMPLGHIGMEK